jgi:malate dehydrogenase (oxaloacetate-decarboxylating)(NADP+)
MSRIVQRAKNAPKRIVFPDGDNIKVLRACQIVLDEGIARPILLGSEKKIRQRATELDLDLEGAELLNPGGLAEALGVRARVPGSCAAARA